MKTCAILIVAAWLLAGLAPARADLAMTLSPSIQNSASGESVVFSGTLTNTGTCGEYLNNIAFALDGSAGTELVSGSNGFYANVPGILTAGGTYEGEIFSMAVAGGAPAADYTGLVTVQGGTNIFASDDLASAGFTVLSPAVSIVATTATAQEFGTAPGIFTVTRTGGTEIPLAVGFGIGGTAVSGSDYQVIGSTVTIAAGASTGTVAITPILQQTALGERSVVLTLQSSVQYDLGSPVDDTVYIEDTPFNDWRLDYFGASANSPQTAPAGDWSGSGVPNVVAYALGIDPTNPSQALLPAAAVVSNYLTLSYVPNPAATDVSYTVEASTDLVNWSTANVQAVSNPPANTVEFRYQYPVSAAPEVFMRLRLTPLDW